MKIICNEETKRREIIKLIQHMMIDTDVRKVDIAQKLGQTEQSTSNLLNPNYRPNNSITIDTLYSICQAMNCELSIEIVKKI